MSTTGGLAAALESALSELHVVRSDNEALCARLEELQALHGGREQGKSWAGSGSGSGSGADGDDETPSPDDGDHSIDGDDHPDGHTTLQVRCQTYIEGQRVSMPLMVHYVLLPWFHAPRRRHGRLQPCMLGWRKWRRRYSGEMPS